MSWNGMHDKDHLLDWESIVDRKLSKKRLAAHHFPPIKYTIDYALPQEWLNNVARNAQDLDYGTILFTTVWLYPDKSEAPAFWLCGIPAVLCEDTARELERQKIPYWTPRGYHGAPL
jgi:hypothetical protein